MKAEKKIIHNTLPINRNLLIENGILGKGAFGHVVGYYNDQDSENYAVIDSKKRSGGRYSKY